MSRRVVNGMHWPNQKTWNLEQLLRAVGDRGAVTVLHHQLFDMDEMTGHGGDHENLLTYGPLRFGVDPARHGDTREAIPAAPERLIHIRAFERHVGGGTSWRDVDPVAFGRHIARKLSRWVGHNYPETNLWLDPNVAASLCNEQNIEGWVVSHLGGEAERRAAYAKIGRWQLVAWMALDAELQNMGIERKAMSCWGALAYGHDMIPDVPDSEYQHPDIRAAIDYCDLLAAHPYGKRGHPSSYSDSNHKNRWFRMSRPFRAPGTDGHRLGGCASQFPGKPLLITEANTFTVDTDPPDVTLRANEALFREAAASGVCVGVTAYMWQASADHYQNDIAAPELRDGFERMPKIETSAQLPIARSSSLAPPPPEGTMHPTDQLYLDRLRARLGPDRVHVIRDQVRSRYRDVPHFNFRRRAGGPDAVEAIVQHHSAADIDADAWDLWDFAVHNAPWLDSAGQARRGWDTISYATVIDRDGVVWVGALPGDFTWHTSGQNPRSYGVVIPGNFVEQKPSDASLESMRHVHAALRESIGLDRQSFGHAEMPGQATACPGDHLLPHVIDMRENGDVGGGVEDGTAALIARMRERQEVTPNPSASLQRAAAEDGFTVLLTNEFAHEWQGADHVAQGVADIRTGRERIYLAPVTNFNDVRSVDA